MEWRALLRISDGLIVARECRVPGAPWPEDLRPTGKRSRQPLVDGGTHRWVDSDETVRPERHAIASDGTVSPRTPPQRQRQRPQIRRLVDAMVRVGILTAQQRDDLAGDLGWTG